MTYDLPPIVGTRIRTSGLHITDNTGLWFSIAVLAYVAVAFLEHLYSVNWPGIYCQTGSQWTVRQVKLGWVCLRRQLSQL